MLDLLNQALAIVRRESREFTQADWFYSGHVEFPDGKHREIFIVQNETGKYTLMLPEDH